MPVYALGEHEPVIDASAFIHPDAILIGRVTIGPEASIWPCAVLRGDFGSIEVGPRSSVQDGTVVHAGADYPTLVGKDCVIGHNAYLEGCTIEDGVLVGSLSSVLPHAVVRRGALIAAGAVVKPGSEVPARALARGIPAQVQPDAVEDGRWAAGVQRYVDMARRYKHELRLVSPGDEAG